MAGMVNQELAKREQELKKKYEDEQKKLERQLAQTREQPPAKTEAAAVPAPPTAAQTAPPVPAPAPAEQRTEPAPIPAPAAAEPEPSRPEPAPAAPEPAPAAPAPVKARAGDLVSGGPGVKPPALVSFPQPGYPPMARKMRIEGTVIVSVLVDERGRVAEATLLQPLKKDFGLNQAALEVARAARYRPATKDGVPVKMRVLLKVPFTL
jgi:protein TonB